MVRWFIVLVPSSAARHGATTLLFTTLNSVENNSLVPRRLGPRPGVDVRPLSASRSAILDRLRDQPEAITQAALVAATGLHPNTVREHLEGLVRRGLVHRFRAEPAGRGRPAWLYEAAAGPGSGEYAGLAAALAGAIARNSHNPREDATDAGTEWGRQLVRDRAAAVPGSTPVEARKRVVDLLDDLGFAPERDDADPAAYRLTRCPLLEAAYRHPEVVCGVHLGIVRGALEEHGVDPEGSELVPFAEPGACRLVVPPTSGNG
jgi:predicted ArsR family transcriptional regulator